MDQSYGKEEVLNYLKKLNVDYEIVEHPPAYTTEDADKYVEGMEGVLSKTLFMSGKKDRNFYLFIMDENKRLDIKKVSELVSDKLQFAKEEYLMKKMGLKPGTVSLFGILNNFEHDIKIYIDEDIMDEEIIAFHPNVNTATIFIKIVDMLKIIDDLDYEYEIIRL